MCQTKAYLSVRGWTKVLCVMGKCRVRKSIRESFEKAVTDIEEERYGVINPYVALDERIRALNEAIASLIDYRNELERIRESMDSYCVSRYLSYPTVLNVYEWQKYYGK